MATSIDFVELKARTHYSFLRGASEPKELVQRAIELGMRALGVADLNGVYGMPKAYLETKEHEGFKLITGAEVTIEALPPVTLIAQTRAGYGRLCRLITAAHKDKLKGEARLTWLELIAHLQDTGGSELIALPQDGPDLDYGALKEILGDRLYLPLTRVLDGGDAEREARVRAISKHYGLKIVATNDVHYHVRARHRLQDTMTAIREGVTVEDAGFCLFSNSERFLKSPQVMAQLFQDLPEAISHTLEIAARCKFSPSELKYQYPTEWIPTGHTAQSYLEELVRKGEKKRWPQGTPEIAAAQIRSELTLIEKLKYADYFLTIWEIVEFARGKKILCQGRGSAANSVVCYCLEITAINPQQINLLFERFISAERGEPPDIDVDFEHDRREEVIQHLYKRYGRDRAGMVAAVITYRSRMAAREVTKAFGEELDHRTLDKLIEDPPEGKVARKRLKLIQSMVEELTDSPRHLSIHSGGFVLSQGPLIETVPIEHARMEGRTIVQWDKHDLDALNLIKVDVLALGMLTALRRMLDMVGLDLYSIKQNDEKTYEMIQKADTVGVFQIESRAQMSMLPRLRPRNFYDLAVQIAIVRPGPIVGGMVHPYLKGRKDHDLGRPIEMPHPGLKKILEKTYGVPIFQEQIMQMAIDLAGFTAGEADQLRRAIGAWRSSGSIEKVGKRLKDGLLKSGLTQEFVDRIMEQIKGFAEYGFPESHAASFAILAYASSYLKCHHPAEFACALVNSQPMGFYQNHSLIDDAKRHGVRVLPVDPNVSDWDCAIESGAIRLGFRVVSGLGEEKAREIVAARKARRFSNLQDFVARARVRPSVLHDLALGDAFKELGLCQREALWKALELEPMLRGGKEAASGQLNLFDALEASRSPAPAVIQPMQPYEEVEADYATYGLSLRGHPMQFLRAMNAKLPQITTAEARALPNGRVTTIAGYVIVRQHPPTAKGVTFATLEDQAGFLDLVIHPEVREKYDDDFLRRFFLIVRGKIQRQGYATSMLVEAFLPVHDEHGGEIGNLDIPFGKFFS